MLAVTRTAMELSVQFITELPGLDTLPRVSALVVGFNTTGITLQNLSGGGDGRDAVVARHQERADALIDAFNERVSSLSYRARSL